MIVIELLLCNIFYLVLKVVRGHEVQTDVYGENQVLGFISMSPKFNSGSLQRVRPDSTPALDGSTPLFLLPNPLNIPRAVLRGLQVIQSHVILSPPNDTSLTGEA
jgi:hypothetical protein